MKTALDFALACWRENLRTGRDNARIEEILGRRLTGNWCGWFAQACYRQAGLIAGVDLGSVYRCRETARYRDPGLLKTWCAERSGETWTPRKVKDLHAMYGQSRQLLKWNPSAVQPGDIILHESKPGASTGHVMLYAGSPGGGLVYLLGGNQRGEFPDLSKGTGITRKVLAGKDHYLTWIVRLSPLDFSPDVRLCKTAAEAATLAAKLNGGAA